MQLLGDFAKGVLAPVPVHVRKEQGRSGNSVAESSVKLAPRFRLEGGPLLYAEIEKQFFISPEH